ncbi:unnamed protein product [Effrenium voratum]|nr:unnamed protein product [Effrenium voratum]
MIPRRRRAPSFRKRSSVHSRERGTSRAKQKKKLPGGFAVHDKVEHRGRRISQLPAQADTYSRWTRARLWLLPVVRHRYFNFFTALAILANAFFMGAETAWVTCSGDAEGIGWFIGNVCFTQLFLAELLLRWFVEGLLFWVDPWNVFDAILVFFSLLDDLVLTFLIAANQSSSLLLVLRFARMLRFVRVLRLLRLFKGLWYLAEGIIASLSSLAWAWLLLIVMMYLPAIFVTQTFGRGGNSDPQMKQDFGNMLQSMYTLFKVMTTESWADIARHAGKVSPGAEVFFVFYIFCTSFAVMNVVVAVIVQNTCVHAKERQEDMRSVQEKKDADAMLKVLEVFQTADVQQSGQVSKKDFLKAMKIPSVMQLMHEVQIDVRQAEALFDVLDYNNSGSLDSEEFVEGIMLARGEARSREVIAAQCDLWKDEHDTINTLEQLEDFVVEEFEGLNTFIETLRSEMRLARGANPFEDEDSHSWDEACLVSPHS